MVQRPLFQIPVSLLFLFSPQPRTAIWLHLKHFASHLLSLGRDLGGLLHTMILSPATPAQSLAVNGEGVRGVPRGCDCTVASMQADPSHHELLQSTSAPIYIYTHTPSFLSNVGSLFQHQIITGRFWWDIYEGFNPLSHSNGDVTHHAESPSS